MKQFLFTFFLIFFVEGFSQNQFNSEDLTVTRADLQVNTFENDSTASALVIYEHGNSYVDKNSFKLVTEVKQKLKIFKKKGFEKAKIAIYLYNDGNRKENISNISATTYNLENNSVIKTQLDKNQIFEEKLNDNNTVVKFTFPNLKEGSVITYSYTLETPFMFKFKEWYFQDDIPKLYSQYETSIPGNYEYNIKLVGLLKLEVNDSELVRNCLEVQYQGMANCIKSNYVMKDIPAFIEEDYMTTKNNYLSRIEYELKTFNGFDGSVEHYTKSWETVDSELKADKEIGKQFNKTSVVKGLLDNSIVNEKDPLTKAKAIYRYLQDNYTWNDKYGIFKDVSIKNLIDEKSGKVSEINILLHNLLDQNGIDVKPVLLSTRDNGFATKIYPVLSDFNYLIVQATINGTSYLLDATDKYLTFGQLPFRCLNQYGRLLDFEKGSSWIDIEAENKSSILYRLELNFDSNAQINGSVNKESSGYHALPLKKAYFENKENYIKSQKEKYNSIDYLDYNIQTEDKNDFEFNENFIIQLETETIGDKIYLNPFVFKFFNENLFKLQERTYPIDFGYKDAFLYTLKLQIDDSYEILEKPKDLAQRLPDNSGTVILNTHLENNTLLLYFKVIFNEPIYNPEYYSSIKKFMSTIVDIQKNSLLVIKKK
ncbi:MAG: DUF3857 domain-containing protein [Gelidibacter sp.]